MPVCRTRRARPQADGRQTPSADNAVEAIESRLHHGRAPAIDINGRAGDVGGGVRRQKAGEIRKLLRPPNAAERDVLDPCVYVFLELNAGLLRGAYMLI